MADFNKPLLYPCPVCDMPMLEKVGLTLRLLQRHDGKAVKTEIDRSQTSGTMRIRCGSCKQGSHIFHLNHEVVGVNELVSVTKHDEIVIET